MTSYMLVLVLKNGGDDEVRKLNDCFVFQSMRCKIMNFCVKSFINCLNGENRVLFLFETEFNVDIFLKEMCETIKSESEVEFINECFVFYGSYGEMINSVHTLDICNDILVLESEF